MAENNLEEKPNPIENTLNFGDKQISIVKCWSERLVHKPKCIVFDLDYTLWPFFIDDQVVKVYKWNEEGVLKTKMVDHKNKPITHYEDITLIIKTLKDICFQGSNSLHMAIASRATMHDRAVEFFELFGWSGYFDSIQIYSGSKEKHMKNIFRELRLSNFNEILFFDDNRSNIEQAQRMGVIAHQVRRHYGLHVNELIKGLEKYNVELKAHANAQNGDLFKQKRTSF